MTVIYEKLKSSLMQEQYTWLITGVAGFIGSNLLHELLKLNQKVIGIDNFYTGFKKNLKQVLNYVSHDQRNNFKFYEGDICSIATCQKVVAGADYVLHQAALGSVPRSLKSPEETHTTNTTGFINILKCSVNANVKRFVFASSSAVYGDLSDEFKIEERIGKPLSPYAVSKYTDELYAHVFSVCYKIETIGLRYFNVFGPFQDPNGPYAAVIPRWIKAILQNSQVVIYGDGETSRDFCYVDNVVQANLLAATVENKNAINTIYNIAVGEQNSLKKLYDLIIKAVGTVSHTDLVHDDFRAGDIRHSLANIDRAKSLMGYSPSHTLADGLKSMMTWYRSSLMNMT